jgi:hypothetical protein
MDVDRSPVTKAARIGFGVLVISIMIIAAPAEAAARHRSHIVRHHQTHPSVRVVQAAPAPAVTLGAMRYYGGPKSPMWRAPAGT